MQAYATKHEQRYNTAKHAVHLNQKGMRKVTTQALKTSQTSLNLSRNS
jgi:hypothetical protein